MAPRRLRRGTGRRQRQHACSAAEKAERPSLPKRITEYLREVRNELVKVAWPGRAEVIKYTIVVFCTVVILTSIVFGLDALFAKLVLLLFTK